MEKLLGIIGIFLFLFTTLDVLWTTLWVDGGAGPLTDRLTTFIWETMKKVDHKGRVLQISGPVILVSILAVWVLLTWVACFLVLLLFEEPLINTIGNRTLNNLDLFYFTGYTLFTFGNGEFAPSPGIVQILASTISAYGMVVLSLGISYVIGVIDGVVQKRAIASNVSAIGQTSEEFLTTSFDGEKFYDIYSSINEFASDLGTLTVRQKAYPLLNYFHTSNSSQALSYVLPILADSLWVMKFGLQKEAGVNQPYVKKSLAAIENYVTSLTILIHDAEDDVDPPSLPDYQMLADAKMPLIDKSDYEKHFQEVSENRTFLYRIKKENFETVLDEFN